MSIYQKIAKIGPKFFKRHQLFKWGFNLSPMYRRSTGRVIEVSDDLMQVKIKIPLSYKNRNYVNSIFGGSMFSAVDPIPMVQLINLLDSNYIIWDKSAEVIFKKPAKEDLYGEFTYSIEELEHIKTRVRNENEIEIVKTTYLTNKAGNSIFSEIKKVLYIAEKKYYIEKKATEK